MLAKVTDAASMLWLSLDAREKRMLTLGAAWLAVSAYLFLAERNEVKQRDDLKASIKAELRQEMSRAQ